jgi:hypothetical protein
VAIKNHYVIKLLPHYTSDLHPSSNIITKVKQDKMGGASSMYRIREMHKFWSNEA